MKVDGDGKKSQGIFAAKPEECFPATPARDETDVRAPKITDVARIAGVSTATVSRALSKPETVAETTRNAVLAAAEQSGYRVNQAARNLRRQRTGAIVVLVPNLGNPFFSEILAGIEVTLSRANLNMLVVDTRQAHARPGLVSEYLHNTRADGIIALDGSLPGSLLEAARSSHSTPPIVFACEWKNGADFPCVRVDNAFGARLAINHLHSLGHHRIGFVSGPSGNVLTETRRAGMLEKMAELGIEMHEEWMFPGDFTLESGVRAAHAWLGLSERPSGVFCASDQMAFGFISQIVRHGLSVPRSVSVVGFDDIDIASRFVPALTTIRQPRSGIGTSAARLLIDHLEGKAAPHADGQTILKIDLVVRDSTAAIMAGE